MVIGQCMARHRHQEFIRFLNRIEAVVPAGKLIHAILDNYAVHKLLKVRAGVERWIGSIKLYRLWLKRRSSCLSPSLGAYGLQDAPPRSGQPNATS